MISLAHAHSLLKQHLGDSPRAVHSLFVGDAMRQLAGELGEDAGMWEVVGLCHDLDYAETRADPARHGLLVAEWLKDDLPADALLAIQAHDHRTGVLAETRLADALKFADALAVADVMAGRDALVSVLAGGEGAALSSLLQRRPFLPGMILKFAGRCGVSLPRLAEICAAARKQ